MTAPRGHVAPPQPGTRSVLRSVAVPTEHGGWDLTLEPVVLGLVIFPSGAGLCLASAALVGFMARMPLKVVLVDASRGRHLERTTVARRLVAAELIVLVALVAGAFVLAQGPFWVPAVVAAPLVGLELWFDMRSRSRRLVPELAGAVGISSVVAMIVLAGAGDARLAGALWLILVARCVTSIPFVRDQIARLHRRPRRSPTLVVADLAALGTAAVSVALDLALTAGAVALAGIVTYQRFSARRPLPRAVVLGLRQMALGFALVAVTAAGVLMT
jgi:hypothetical protein